MINNKIESYLQTWSGSLLHTIESGPYTGYLTIVPYSGANLISGMGLNEAKFSFFLLSGQVAIAQIDNDHPLNISGCQFFGLHEHEFLSGNTIRRIPVEQIKSINEAGLYADSLLKEFL